MDWDDIAWRLAGPEGGLRYFRMGIFLVVMGIVALAAVGFTPLYMNDDQSLTYDMLAEEPDDDVAFGVPNSHVLGHANWALVGAALTIVMGLAFILEGKRVIHLRKLLVWHAEARATALFSLAAATSSVGLLAGASIIGLTESMPEMYSQGIHITLEAYSPAAIVVVVALGIATGGMLGMAYYNAVLSVYRGGGEAANRRMTRFAMLLAALSLGGLLFLRVGVIMTAKYEMAAAPDIEITMWYPYTMSQVDQHAGVGGESMGLLDTQLSVASTILWLAALSGMGAMVGASARSLGGASRRVRFAAALPLLGILLASVSLLLLAWASSTAPTAAIEDRAFPGIEVTLGWGLFAGVLLGLGALVGALGYMRDHGVTSARDALWIMRRPEAEAEAAEEGIPQPMVDQALAEEARARGEFPPVEPEAAPSPPLRERLLLRNARRNQLVIAAVLVALIILIAVLWPGGPGGGGGDDGPGTVVIGDLPEFTWDVTSDEYLREGEHLVEDPFDVIRDNPTTTIFVSTVTVTVTWTDEADAGILWTNEPDTFTAIVDDDQGIDTAEVSGANPQGGQGRVTAVWSTGTAWVVTGNTDLADWGDQEVYTGVMLRAGASMDSAGDQVTRLGRTQTDGGNSYDLSISISGRQYSPP